jgi:hypothetical protein
VQYYVTWRSSLPEYMRLFAGYDTLSNPRLASIATTARDTGDVALTYPFQSVLGSTSAVAMYYPVYKQVPGANATVEFLRATLTGAESILLLVKKCCLTIECRPFGLWLLLACVTPFKSLRFEKRSYCAFWNASELHRWFTARLLQRIMRWFGSLFSLGLTITFD